MVRRLTKITLYQNTPFTDFTNSIQFKDNTTRDDWFRQHYPNALTFERDFNFVRDRLILKVDTQPAYPTGQTWADLQEVNYCQFVSAFDGITYYAQVVEAQYLNDGTTALSLVIDGLMTFCQGDISPYAKNVQIERQHLTNKTFSDNEYYLQTNDDTLKFGNMRYIHSENIIKFSDFYVVMRSLYDLSADLGNFDKPNMKSASGITYDRTTSPQNLYIIEYDKLNDLYKSIADYPWITQGITNILQIPQALIQDDIQELEPVTMKNNFDGLKTFKNGGLSNNLPRWSHRSIESLSSIFNVDMQAHPELRRKEYLEISMTNWQGQDITINPANLDNEDGLTVAGQVNIGYNNIVAFFIKGYRVDGEQSLGDDFGTYVGDYLNNAIIFKDWDEVPVLTDQYKLSMASTANQRALAENNLLSGQVGNVLDNSGNTSTQDRFMSAVNLLNGGLSIANLGGKMIDEWQFYRQQQAQFADMRIQKPTLTNQTTKNSFAIKNDIFGLFIRYSRIGRDNINMILDYHANFGYDWHTVGDLDSTQSMSHLNYVRFKGNWNIHDRHVPQAVMEQIRVQFENGVKLWHNPENLAPIDVFKQNLSYANRRII